MKLVSGLLSNQREKSIHFFHNGSFKEKSKQSRVLQSPGIVKNRMWGPRAFGFTAWAVQGFSEGVEFNSRPGLGLEFRV